MTRWFAALILLLGPSLGAQSPVPEIPFESVPEPLKMPPDLHLGEVAGVAVNSKGHVFVYNRGNSTGPAYAATASQLLEFGPDGRFVREIGKNLYAWSYAHVVRIDREDNIWAVDKGSDMIIRFNPAGRVTMVFGRKKEASDEAEPWTRVDPPRPHVDQQYRQPTDAKGNIYVADRGNRRRQVFDTEGAVIREIRIDVPYDAKQKPATGNMPSPQALAGGTMAPGAPWAICITPGPTQYLYASDAYPGRVYKLSLDGQVLGVLGKSGKMAKQFGWIHEIAYPSENEGILGKRTLP